jgi:hypothetical protein
MIGSIARICQLVTWDILIIFEKNSASNKTQIAALRLSETHEVL